MQLDFFEAAVRLSILVAIPSILGSAALITIIACRQRMSEYLRVSGSSELDHKFCSNDTVILVLFAIVEFSLTGGAIIFGLVKHILLR